MRKELLGASLYEIENLVNKLVITDGESIYKKAKKEEPTFYNKGTKKKTIKDSIKQQKQKHKHK